MSSYSRAASALQLQPRDPRGINRFGRHDVGLMGLSTSVVDIWGVGRLYLRRRNIHPSEGTFNEAEGTGREEPSDREQVSISWYL